MLTTETSTRTALSFLERRFLPSVLSEIKDIMTRNRIVVPSFVRFSLVYYSEGQERKHNPNDRQNYHPVENMFPCRIFCDIL